MEEEAPKRRHRLRRWMAGFAVLAGATAVGVAVVPGQRDRELRTGVAVHPLWSDATPEDADRELDLAAEAGANTVRVDLSWSTLELNGKGQRDPDYIARVDRFLDAAKARHLKVVATFWSTPCWASTAPESLRQGCRGRWWERDVQRYPPRDSTDYADAAAWAARRWGDRLDAFEVWNEPNLPAFLRGADPAASYADMLRTAYPRLKAAAPDLPVLGGVLATSDGRFLERLYAAGVKGHWDGLSYHPYGEGRDPSRAGPVADRRYSYQRGTEWIRQIQKAHGDEDTPLWQTEVGFTTCTPGPRRPCVSEEDQARYITEVFRIARERMPYVKAVIVYNLRNKGTDPDDIEAGFGLVNRDFSPKPAFESLTRALSG